MSGKHIPRIDRWLTVYLVHPWLAQRKAEPAVPVLMYHSISGNHVRRNCSYFHLCTSAVRFEQHLVHLQKGGYTAITLDALLACKERAQPLPPRSVVLTFDDGYRDLVTTAMPLLKRHGMTGCAFLPTAFLGQKSKHFRGRSCLTWKDAAALRDAGMTIGTHTVTHPRLYECSAGQIAQELDDSRRELEERLAITVDLFAYPGAFPQADRSFRDILRRILLDGGFRGGVTTMIGRVHAADDPLFLKRLPVNNADSPALFAAKLDGAYDWLSNAQRVWKAIRSNGRAARATSTGSSRIPRGLMIGPERDRAGGVGVAEMVHTRKGAEHAL